MAVKKTKKSSTPKRSVKAKKTIKKPEVFPVLPKKRKVKTAAYRSFRISRRIRVDTGRIPGSFRLLKQALIILKTNWDIYLGIGAVYALLSLILVRGLSSGTNLTEVRDEITMTFGNLPKLLTGVTLYSYLLQTPGGQTSETGSVYQLLLIIILSLVTIWSIRHLLADKIVTVREAYYRGTYGLIPFILVLFVISVQLLPLLIGGWLYSNVISIGIAVGPFETAIILLIFGLLAILSLYMVCSSLFALYIVTLPDMTPLSALRSARQLVLHRRWTILRKVLFLPIVLVVVSAVVMFPLLIFATALAEWVFFGLTIFGLMLAHAYMYNLYRSLL